MGQVLGSGDTSRLQYMIEDDEEKDLYANGGDILMDSKGNILYIYRSKTFDDRPSVQQLLDASPSSDCGQNLAADQENQTADQGICESCFNCRLYVQSYPPMVARYQRVT